MTKLHRIVSGSLLALALAVPASAQANGKGGWVLQAGAEFGGDQIATVYFTNGSSQSVNAGQGAYLGVGGHYRPWNSPWDFSGTLNYKFQGVAASSGSAHSNINMSRTVLEFRADHHLQDGWWVGAGPVYHTSISFNADGAGPNVGFDSAMGLTVKAGWKWVALSYTNIKYKDEYGFSYDASNFGVAFIGRF